MSHSHTYMYFEKLLTFFALLILKKIRIYQVWFFFGVIPAVLILICAILEQSINNKMVGKT